MACNDLQRAAYVYGTASVLQYCSIALTMSDNLCTFLLASEGEESEKENDK